MTALETMSATEPNYAPGPYTTVDVGSHAGFHTYVVDATGRKIGVAWGPQAQKVWTAALFAGSTNMLTLLKAMMEAYDEQPICAWKGAIANIINAIEGRA